MNQLTRDEIVWLKAWTAVASAENTENSVIATRWANDCLKEFKNKFGSSE